MRVRTTRKWIFQLRDAQPRPKIEWRQKHLPLSSTVGNLLAPQDIFMVLCTLPNFPAHRKS
jgi:hypothetical protein